MEEIKFYYGENIPLELHKVRIVQKLHLVPIERRLKALEEGGYNTFRLTTNDVFLDMLTDSGTNAMSDNQLAAMMRADDAYAGSQSFLRLQKAVEDVLGKKYYLPVHQGRAAENILTNAYIKKGSLIPMNYHFTTTMAHITQYGGKISELLYDEGYVIDSDHPFKGNMNIEKLEETIKTHGAKNIPFIRMEASTNLIGGQPFSIQNLRDVKAVAEKYKIRLVLDASLLGENAYLIHLREDEFKESSLGDIIKIMTDLADIVYLDLFAARRCSASDHDDDPVNVPVHPQNHRECCRAQYGGKEIRHSRCPAQSIFPDCPACVRPEVLLPPPTAALPASAAMPEETAYVQVVPVSGCKEHSFGLCQRGRNGVASGRFLHGAQPHSVQWQFCRTPVPARAGAWHRI